MSTHHPSPLVLAAFAAVGGAAAVLLGVLLGPAELIVAVLVAAGLIVTLPVPWGGTVPMGVAAVTPAVALLDPVEAAATLSVALVLGSAVLLARVPGREARANIDRFAVGLVAALASATVLDLLVAGDPAVLASVCTAGAAMLAADVALSRWLGGAHRIEVRSAIPVHLTLTCAGALIGVAVDGVGVAMAAVAAFPLLITRFSFQRYAGATDTLQQTVQALGLVPELAGLAPLGHSERSASYAVALSRSMGLDRAATTRVVTATRLHHLGAVPLQEVDDTDEQRPGDVAVAGARVLREAGFPEDVATLLESAKADTLDAEAPTLEAAVVRVAATFDELVGEDPHGADRGLALVTAGARDTHSRRVAGALLELVATHPGLVGEAVAAGDRFREAAIGVDLEAVTARRGNAELLPFARRG